MRRGIPASLVLVLIAGLGSGCDLENSKYPEGFSELTSDRCEDYGVDDPCIVISVTRRPSTEADRVLYPSWTHAPEGFSVEEYRFGDQVHEYPVIGSAPELLAGADAIFSVARQIILLDRPDLARAAREYPHTWRGGSEYDEARAKFLECNFEYSRPDHYRFGVGRIDEFSLVVVCPEFQFSLVAVRGG